MCLKQLQLSRYPTNPESITTRHRRETLRLTFPCMIWRGLGEARGGCPSTWQPSHSTGVPCSQEIVRPYRTTLGPQAQSYRLCGNLAEGFLGTLASNQFLEERNAWYYADYHGTSGETQRPCTRRPSQSKRYVAALTQCRGTSLSRNRAPTWDHHRASGTVLL